MSGSAARAQRQHAHKLGLQPAAHRTQPLRMRQRHAVHCSAGEGAGQTRRNVNEREQGNALRVAQLRPNKHAVQQLEHGQQRQRLCVCRHLQRCSRILLLHLLLPLPLDGATTRSAAHLQLCVALHACEMLQVGHVLLLLFWAAAAAGSVGRFGFVTFVVARGRLQEI